MIMLKDFWSSFVEEFLPAEEEFRCSNSNGVDYIKKALIRTASKHFQKERIEIKEVIEVMRHCGRKERIQKDRGLSWDGFPAIHFGIERSDTLTAFVLL